VQGTRPIVIGSLFLATFLLLIPNYNLVKAIPTGGPIPSPPRPPVLPPAKTVEADPMVSNISAVLEKSKEKFFRLY
jgi:hypothetical protein